VLWFEIEPASLEQFERVRHGGTNSVRQGWRACHRPGRSVTLYPRSALRSHP